MRISDWSSDVCSSDLSLALPPFAAAIIALAFAILVTGGLHEDGLADVADGFGGGHDKARKLAIMRDSRIGTYGVLALALVPAEIGRAACRVRVCPSV